MDNKPEILDGKIYNGLNNDVTILTDQKNVCEILSSGMEMNEPDEKTVCSTTTSLVVSNETNPCDMVSRSCDLMLQKQRKRKLILNPTLHKISRNHDIIYMQLMKLLNCNKIRKREPKDKNIGENTSQKISKSKTYVDQILKHLTKFIEILGLDELISEEQTSSLQGTVCSTGFKVTQTPRSKIAPTSRKKSLALLEIVLKILKMKNRPKLALIKSPNLQIVIDETPKKMKKDNWITGEFQPEYKSNCLNKTSNQSMSSNYVSNCSIAYKIENSNTENKHEKQTNFEHSSLTQSSLDTKTSSQLSSSLKSNETIDVRAIKSVCENDNSNNNIKLETKKINSNTTQFKPLTSSSEICSENDPIKIDTYEEILISGPSASRYLNTCYNTNLTTVKHLQRKGHDPSQSLLTGHKQTLLGKRTNEVSLEEFSEFERNVILTSAPFSEEFNKVLEERTVDNQNVFLEAYKIIKDCDIENVKRKYRRCLDFLELNQRSESMSYFGNSMPCPYSSNRQFNLLIEHRKQKICLKRKLKNVLRHIDANFEDAYNRLLNQQRKYLNTLRETFRQNSLRSETVTIPFCKAPNRENNYTICYQELTSTPRIIITLLREDEVYDSFYTHKISR